MGPSAFWARLPSAIYGILLVVLCWAFGKKLFGMRGGLIAGLLTAVIPWSFHFSRYGVVILTSYVFYVTLATYLFTIYFQTKKENVKFGAFIVVGISLYTHAMALMFNLVFFPILFVAGTVFSRFSFRKILVDLVLFFITMLLVASPFLVGYLSPAEQFSFTQNTTMAHSDNALDFIRLVMTRAYMHLSPDFLMISGGKSFALSSGSFGELMTPSSLYYYDTAGQIGMLNIYGIFFYVGFLWIVYEIVKNKRVKFSSFLLIWWILSYALVSGFAFYDNPNSARNIVGLPAFILVMSLIIDKLWVVLFDPNGFHIFGREVRVRLPTKTLKALFIIALILPSMFYLSTYFTIFEHSYDYFDYDYRLLSNYLTANNYWSNPLVINETRPDKWYAKTVLSFYNHSARENIIEGDLANAIPLLESEEDVAIYITRDTSQQDELSSVIPSKLLDVIRFPDGEPVFAVWELRGPIGKQTLLVDDNQAILWTTVHGTLSGKRGPSIISDENSIVKSGSNSLKIVLTSGSWNWSGIQHNFEPAMNWSDTSGISFQWYGSKSGMTIQLIIICEGGEFYHSFIDDFQGWRRFVIFFYDMQKNDEPLLDKVNAITFAFWGDGEATMYLDKITLL
jgi:hypothetical protein